MPKPKMNYRNLSNQVQYVMKTRQDNNMIDHVDTVYAEKDTKLSWHVGLGADYDEK